MADTALLIIDFQNDYFPGFPGAKWPLAGTEAAAANGAALLAKFRAQGLPVFHVRHEFPNADAPFFQPGSEGAQIHAGMAPLEGEAVIVKQQINSFRDTGLQQQLQQAGIRRLVIVGAMSHMCIDAATRAAADFGYECLVAHDACATLDMAFDGVNVPAAQVHAAFMAALQFGYAKVESTEALLQAV
ncbi:MAG: cysteine hydrolase family protein [Neisseria sp.]|nr:cysteine hydrolase family protein [Neisseria sp.]